MAKSVNNPKVDFFFEKAKKWKEEFIYLRKLAMEVGLTEELKWGCPCYTLANANVFLIHGFKEYCALLFMKGALMKDPGNLLIQQTENVQAARQIRFADLKEIVKSRAHITSYIKQAIQIEKSGLKLELKKTTEFKMPDEFKVIMENLRELKTAFYNLTPGRQRAYLLYFSSPKQSKTRESRIQKYIQPILDGKGLND